MTLSDLVDWGAALQVAAILFMYVVAKTLRRFVDGYLDHLRRSREIREDMLFAMRDPDLYGDDR